MSHNKKVRVMKSLFIITFTFLLSLNIAFAQRIATHTLTNFDVNTSINKFSFDIYSQSTGAQSIRVGLTSYYINFNNTALSTPVISNINPKYTTGSPTGDYGAMTVQIALGKIAVTISFSGNGDGTGDVLSTSSPNGELIGTVTLDITDQNATAMVNWDEINSKMNTPTFQLVTNNYQGSFDGVLPVELTSFTSKLLNDKIQLNWVTKTEVNNYGFNVERRINEGEWNTIGFVEGNRTTTESKEYSFSDKDIYAGGSKFQYRLKQIDFDGSFEYSDVVEVGVVANQFELSQNYPNPFNPSTTIRFSLPKDTQLKINIYNMLGELVKTLAEGTYQAGYHKVTFSALGGSTSNGNVSLLPSGVYIYRIESNEFVQVKKMILMK
ncbi:MAG: T9SS C-terminal target domain-containing protein [Ignavibacteriae bacterium]|jgi:hypothetical protein|nr:MAG: T9SS C-terminal target domain-containing protein [Chlorobiota bacterium]MBL1122275.1 T9SS C-terminal target domain-containing protein [Ignavibacteriota bacterium]MCE7858108.1 T9SS C-terminal target domain-containing protein [Ignavibacteria bacterium CHB3]